MLVSHFTSQASLSDPERVLYASLAPSPQTSAILKSACRTWEDHLWAQISVMCEEKQSAEMIRLGGGFWDVGLEVVEKGVVGVSGDDGDPDDDDDEEAEWEREAVGALESLGNVSVLDG
jgi:nuclear pore complex protein Nup107